MSRNLYKHPFTRPKRIVGLMAMSRRSLLALALISVIVCSMLVGVQSVKAVAKTIVVPDDYPTIQAAIDNANAGDTVFVKEGTYNETIVITKSISLIGEERETTVINSNGATSNII